MPTDASLATTQHCRLSLDIWHWHRKSKQAGRRGGPAARETTLDRISQREENEEAPIAVWPSYIPFIRPLPLLPPLHLRKSISAIRQTIMQLSWRYPGVTTRRWSCFDSQKNFFGPRLSIVLRCPAEANSSRVQIFGFFTPATERPFHTSQGEAFSLHA